MNTASRFSHQRRASFILAAIGILFTLTGCELTSTATSTDPFATSIWVPATGYNVYNQSAGTSTFSYNGNSITEIIGVAVPVVTPLAVAVGKGMMATKS